MMIYNHESGRILEHHFWFLGWWGRVFLPTEFNKLWSWARVRPKWVEKLEALKLFLGIVWRDYEGSRILFKTAKEVAFDIVGKRGKVGIGFIPSRPSRRKGNE